MTTIFDVLRRLSTSVVPVVVMAGFMLASLWLLSAATENSAQFGRMHVALVVINVLGLIVLTGLIGIDLVRLVRQYRRAATGSRFTARLVGIFVVMSVVPVLIVFYFSQGFIQRGIDSWFDVRIERAMDNALRLSQSSIDVRMRNDLKQVREMAATLVDTPDAMVLFDLNELRDRSAASELTLMSQSGHIISSSSAGSTAIIPQRPGDLVLSQVRENGSYVGLKPIDNMGLHIRVAVQVDSPRSPPDPRVLFALFPMDARVSLLADGVQSAYSKYKELVYLRGPLKQSFSFTLWLVVLVTLLSAVWAAFFLAQRLVAPLRILAIGTRAVAAGNYHKKLPATGDDELGMLVQSFVDMTEKISTAQEEVKRSQQQTERERAYLRAVLGRLSSGVITFDKKCVLRAANTAASHILDVDFDAAIGCNLAQLESNHPEARAFVQALCRYFEGDGGDWREEVSVVGATGHKTISCQGASLPGTKGMPAGYVVVFDDVTALIQAQRNAAWGEVARRLAHEIKNPLTPIQLSAERLRYKYLATLSPQDAEVLDRSTHTIIQQVQSMKEMVQAFSEYARSPELHLQPLSLATVIDEVLDLYRGENQRARIVFDPKQPVPNVEADPGRIRQLVHNLLRNAIESISGRGDGEVHVGLRQVSRNDHQYVELSVRDNGPGIPDDMLDKLFEPYATSKPKGSGLGLAVVKRIVEEHSGVLYAENRHEGGARLVVRLPALTVPENTATVVRLSVGNP